MKTTDDTKVLYLVGGSLLIMMGLFVISFAFIPLSGAKIIIFPLMFENVNTITSVLMSLMFFSMFAITSLLPFYLSLRRNKVYEWDEGIYMLQGNRGYSTNITESIEYMITTEIPDILKDTIYIEDNLNEVVLKSEKDPNFERNYNVPDTYIIDSVESAYEDSFLLLKIKLVRD
jgi:hypothetical protein